MALKKPGGGKQATKQVHLQRRTWFTLGFYPLMSCAPCRKLGLVQKAVQSRSPGESLLPLALMHLDENPFRFK